MSQHIFNDIVPVDTSGPELAVLLNEFRDTYASGASGSSRPTNILEGGYWVDTSVTNKLIYKWFVDATDVTILTYDKAANELTVAGLPPDVFRADGSVPMTDDLDMGAQAIINIVQPDPTADGDLANKNYVDDSIAAAASPTVGNLMGLQGTRAAPINIVAGTGIPFSGTKPLNNAFVQGNSAPITVTANPQIAAGSAVGQRLLLLGRSDTNYVKLADGNGISLLEGNSDLYLYSNTRAEFIWDGTVWEQF